MVNGDTVEGEFVEEKTSRFLSVETSEIELGHVGPPEYEITTHPPAHRICPFVDG